MYVGFVSVGGSAFNICAVASSLIPRRISCRTPVYFVFTVSEVSRKSHQSSKSTGGKGSGGGEMSGVTVGGGGEKRNLVMGCFSKPRVWMQSAVFTFPGQ